MYGQHFQQSMNQPGMVTNSARGQLDKEIFFSFLRLRLRNWSLVTGSAVPSRVSLLIPDSQAECGAYSRNFSRFPRRCPYIPPSTIESVPSLWDHATILRVLPTNGVHCRDFAGIEPVVIEVVPVMSAAFVSPWTN